MIAHIGGLPVEETIAMFAPAGGVAIVAAVQVARARARRSVGRLAGAFRTRRGG